VRLEELSIESKHPGMKNLLDAGQIDFSIFRARMITVHQQRSEAEEQENQEVLKQSSAWPTPEAFSDGC